MGKKLELNIQRVRERNLLLSEFSSQGILIPFHIIKRRLTILSISVSIWEEKKMRMRRAEREWNRDKEKRTIKKA